MFLSSLPTIDSTVWVAIVLLNSIFFVYLTLRWRSGGGMTIDIFYIIKLLYLPVFMIPFAYSELNINSTGDKYYQYIDFIPQAVGVLVVGIVATIMGAILGLSLRIKPLGLRWIQESLTGFWFKPFGINFVTAVTIVVSLSLIILGFTPGAARADAFQRPDLRFLYNTYTVLISFSTLLVLSFAYIKRSMRYFFIGFLLLTLGFLSGTRATSIGPIISLIAFYTITTKTRRLLPILLGGFIVSIGLVWVVGFRDGVYDLSYVARAPELLLFGNTLSDFRDFAWILSGWDGKLLAGSTYISGFLSFIPSAFLPLRTETSWAYFSLKYSGLGVEAIDVHPGLRPIIFGELYFNFGIVGVFIGGVVLGFTLTQLARLLDNVSSNDAQRRPRVVLASIIYMDYCLLQFFNTSGFFTFYVICGLMFLGLVLQSAKRRRRSYSFPRP
jgi:oligosaccharide repeat unit polymerase